VLDRSRPLGSLLSSQAAANVENQNSAGLWHLISVLFFALGSFKERLCDSHKLGCDVRLAYLVGQSEAACGLLSKEA
jgi:hypothetical protein